MHILFYSQLLICYKKYKTNIPTLGHLEKFLKNVIKVESFVGCYEWKDEYQGYRDRIIQGIYVSTILGICVIIIPGI